MIPGPQKVILCPHCGHKARVGTILSYSMVGAIAWTDGKIWSMAPNLPAITRCTGCSEFYWVSEAKVVGEFYEWGGYRVISSGSPDRSRAKWRDGEPPAEWLSLDHVRHLTGKECLLAIRKGLARTEADEKYLRILAWWSHNDQYRTAEAGLETKGSPPKQVRENLEKLRELLDEEDYSDRLFKAEIERELGHFDEARRLLVFDFPRHVREVAVFIDQLAQKGDTVVRKVPREDCEDCWDSRSSDLGLEAIIATEWKEPALFQDITMAGLRALRGKTNEFLSTLGRSKASEWILPLRKPLLAKKEGLLVGRLVYAHKRNSNPISGMQPGT